MAGFLFSIYEIRSIGDGSMMAGLLFSIYEIRTKGDGSSVFFLWWQLGDLKILKKKKKKREKHVILRFFFLPFLGIKIIKFSISRPRLFVVQHLLQHFGEML
jgi:hypothetical protein